MIWSVYFGEWACVSVTLMCEVIDQLHPRFPQAVRHFKVPLNRMPDASLLSQGLTHTRIAHTPAGVSPQTPLSIQNTCWIWEKRIKDKKIPTMSLGKTTMCSSLSHTSFRCGRIPRRPPLRLPQMLRFPMRLVGVTAPMTAEGLSRRSCHAAWQLWANHGPAAVIDSSERAGTVKSGTFVYVGCYIHVSLLDV